MNDNTTPKEFAAERLNLIMWHKFAEIFDAIANGHRRILVRSANGVGKTTALAALCNWKLATCDECIVITTSSSNQQARHNLWGEIRRQAKRAELYDPKCITNKQIVLDDKRFMVAVNPAKPESAQGYHAASILIAVDEATAVRRDILESLIATATGDDVQIIMIYNPITPDSFVYEAERSGQWKLITISALEHPNIIEDKNIIKGAITMQSLTDNLAIWSEPALQNEAGAFEFAGNWWRTTLEVSRRILGEWHQNAGEGLISHKLINDSLNIHALAGKKTMGVDLAAGGADETVIARFDGGIQLPFITLRTRNVTRICEAIADEHAKGFTCIALDETGAVGALTPLLFDRGITAYSVHFAAAATRLHDNAHRKLANARIEMYYNLYEELKSGTLRLTDDPKLLEELAAPKLSTKAERERYYLEPKQEIRKRLSRSPDRADATALARYALLIERNQKESKLI